MARRPPSRKPHLPPGGRAAMADASGVRVCLSTAPAAAARRIAKTLVEERLAACVNVLPGVSSTYRWKGAVETAPESLLVIKTAGRRARKCLARLHELHPYDVPEALVLRPKAGFRAYLAWVTGSL